MKTHLQYLVQTRNTFYGTRYLSHCCVLFCTFFNIQKRYWSTRVPMLPDWVTWRHRSRYHKNRSRWFPMCAPLTPTLYLVRFPRYWASNILGVMTYRSRDHKTPLLYLVRTRNTFYGTRYLYRRPYNLYCVGGDVKPCSINQAVSVPLLCSVLYFL